MNFDECALTYTLFLPNNSSLTRRIEDAKSKRRNTKDLFRSHNGYSWDYVMVFKVYQETEALTEFQRSYSMKYIMENLSAAGLFIRSFYSIKVWDLFFVLKQ